MQVAPPLTPPYPHTLTPSHPHTLTPSHPHTPTPSTSEMRQRRSSRQRRLTSLAGFSPFTTYSTPPHAYALDLKTLNPQPRSQHVCLSVCLSVWFSLTLFLDMYAPVPVVLVKAAEADVSRRNCTLNLKILKSNSQPCTGLGLTLKLNPKSHTRPDNNEPGNLDPKPACASSD